MKTFDDIIRSIGEFGFYQKRTYFSVCFVGYMTTAVIVLNVFILGVPEHRMVADLAKRYDVYPYVMEADSFNEHSGRTYNVRCKIPSLENDTFDIQSETHEARVNASIPPDIGGLHPYDRCNLYLTNDGSNNGTKATYPCSEWVYDTSVFLSTFSKEHDFVCDKAIMIPNAQMIMFVGVLTGSLVFGQISDFIGRRKTQYLGIWLLALSVGGLAAVQEYIGLCIALFLSGAANLGTYMTSFVLGMELVGPSKRRLAGSIIHFFNVAGDSTTLLVVYLLRSWRYITATIAAPMCILLTYYWFTPESCRWLLAKGRKEEAVKIMKIIAKSNKKELNEKDVDELEPPRKDERIWLLFSHRVVAIRTLILFYNWFVCSMAYYGFLWNVGNLGGDFYLNFVLTMSVECLSDIFSFFALTKVGRRTLHMFYMLVGGVFCISTLWPILDGSDSLHPVLIAFSLVGQFSVVGAFFTVYLLSSELYPTVVRNGGMGASSAVARIGSMISPYIAKSADIIGGKEGKAIPLTVFGVAMFVAGVSTYFLPETRNRPLPETIEDAKHMTRTGKTVDVQETQDGKTAYNNETFENDKL